MAGRLLATNVVELRPGHVGDVLTCRRCGGDEWIATVKIDRDTMRPTSLNPQDKPVLRCRFCARGYDPPRPDNGLGSNDDC